MASYGAAGRKGRGMTDSELVALLDGQITDAVSYEGSELSLSRIRALEFVDGQIDIPSEDGKSSVVSHDLGDTLGWIMPGLLRVFLASENIVRYEARRSSGVDAAKQATDYVNAVFMSECDGYRVLHNSFYDGLLFGNGVVKHYWDETPQFSTENYTGLSDAQYMALVSDESVEEVLEHSEYPDPDVAPSPSMPSMPLMPPMPPPVPPAPAGMPQGSAMPPMPGGQP